MSKTKVAVIGSGNFGTDLMIKVLRTSQHLEMGAMVGIDAASDGLARAARLGVPVTHEGVDEHLDAPNVNMVTCGGQATIPVVAAVSRVVPVEYAEMVASGARYQRGTWPDWARRSGPA